MAHITKYPGLRHLRADAASHIQHFRQGKRVRSDRGLAFFFLPTGTSISEIPMDDRALPFLLKGQSADYQDLTVQNVMVWRVADPERLGERVDFAINLDTGQPQQQPIDQINDVLATLARRFALAYLKQRSVREVLENGVAPLQEVIVRGFEETDTLAEMGLALVDFSIADIAPSSELARALQAPTFESLHQQADEASFARRAMAVEKERAIAENELNNKIELAARQGELIAREVENERSEAEAKAALKAIEAEAEAHRIRDIDQARADMERARVAVYADIPPAVLMAMATNKFASKLGKIDNLTITPDMLSGLAKQMRGMLAQP